ncbi:MAG: Maf family protein [Clostridia bacterium]|nr:Maf family protein [Clostridia bacterium]
MKIILASKSPRRIELVSLMGLDCASIPCTAEERIDRSLPPEEVVKALARQKADFVFKDHPDCCVIGADTVVYLDGEIIGKPKSERDAFSILSRLSGRTHLVYTGLAVMTHEVSDVRHCITEVTFHELSENELNWYISTKEPMDKAGAYGMQGVGGVFIKNVSGSYFNIIGLPIDLLYHMLLEARVIKEDHTIV